MIGHHSRLDSIFGWKLRASFLPLYLLFLSCTGVQCKDRVITIEGEVIEGALGSISADGIVEIAGQKLPMDGLRSIVPGSGADQAKDLSDGRVVLICGSEIAASGVKVLEEEVMCTVGGLGEVRLPIDAVRALRFG